MAIGALLNQTCTIAVRSHADRHTKSVVGAGTSVRCRFQQTQKTMVNAQKETEPIDGMVFVPSTTTVEIGDKLTFGSKDYRIMTCEPMVDGLGATRHIELKVQLWK